MSRIVIFLRQLQERAIQKGLEGELEDLMQEAWEIHQENRSETHLQTLNKQGFYPQSGESLPTWANLPHEPDWANHLLAEFASYYLSKESWRWELLCWMALPLAYQEGTVPFFTALSLILGYHWFRTREERALKEEYGRDWVKKLTRLVDQIIDDD